MKIKLNSIKFDEGLKKLIKDYKIVAPVVTPFSGTFSDTPIITYKEVTSFGEMEFDKKSSFSPKEVILPITQLLFTYDKDGYSQCNPSEDERKILIFLRACDINGIKRLDQIFLQNGVEEDFYYKTLREKVKYVVVGCKESFRNCFCVSMSSNKTDDYAMGLNIFDDNLQLEIKDESLNVFEGEKDDFEIAFVEKNLFSVDLPNVDKLDPIKVSKSEMWNEYNERCIACGRCNFVCPTCSCFTMQDVAYKENSDQGERRRVWASCHINGYTKMAGGEFRKTKAERMRFKVLHKVYDYKKRFGYNMCVGCGRCDDVCPQYISFSSSIGKLTNLINEEDN